MGLDGMTLRERLMAHLDEILEIADQYGATNVRVFGSVATGRYTAKSDVDLLVDLPPDAASGPMLLAVGGLAEEVTQLLGVRVDVATVELLRPEIRSDALHNATPL
jgi:predicted nucleotidyltransferase